MTGLGDTVKAALDAAGVTEERVERWLGAPCGGCRERRAKLNQIGWAASRILRGKVKDVRAFLDELFQDGDGR